MLFASRTCCGRVLYFSSKQRRYKSWTIAGNSNNNTVVTEESAKGVLENVVSSIKAVGPMTIADYMRTALLSPDFGYYIGKQVFGRQGDFVTSPEISQLFGELISVWSVHEWEKLRCPKPLQIVELGPGRGAMIKDILKVYNGLKLNKDISVHLVEISPKLSRLQYEALCGDFGSSDGHHFDKGGQDTSYYRRGRTKEGVEVFWYTAFSQVPKGFSCILANEFFDALPIHKFQKTEDGWREVLIDIDKNTNNCLRYVISRHPTPASKLFAPKDSIEESGDKGKSRGGGGADRKPTTDNHREVSPESCLLIKEMCCRLEEDGGMALIIDYGHTGDKHDTFRAFKGHEVHDPLVDPGNADLTADVDFSYLKNCAPSDQAVVVGPVSQNTFLNNMHINLRLQILLRNCKTKEERDNLMSGYRMLMDGDKMGDRFKIMALFPAVLDKFIKAVPVAGFGQS